MIRRDLRANVSRRGEEEVSQNRSHSSEYKKNEKRQHTSQTFSFLLTLPD